MQVLKSEKNFDVN